MTPRKMVSRSFAQLRNGRLELPSSGDRWPDTSRKNITALWPLPRLNQKLIHRDCHLHSQFQWASEKGTRGSEMSWTECSRNENLRFAKFLISTEFRSCRLLRQACRVRRRNETTIPIRADAGSHAVTQFMQA